MRQQWRLNTVPHRARLFFTFGCGRILFVVHRNRKGRRHFEGLYVRGIQVADVLPGPVLVAERSANKVCVLVRVAGHLQLLVGETVLGRKKDDVNVLLKLFPDIHVSNDMVCAYEEGRCFCV